MPASKDMPSTVRRSGAKARRTWGKAHDSAVESYGEGERAHRTAFSALKHTHEDEPGPSDERAKDPRARQRRGGTSTGGVDVEGSTKDELLARARDLEVRGRSSMTKQELAEAISRANDRATAKAREG